MYSNKLNVQILSRLLIDHGIESVVLCPGSRDAPIVQTLAHCPELKTYSIVDERSAGFFALGLIQATNKPVAVVVTSGSALLNLHPSVSEAFYQKLPLIVVSADRPQAWIGQMDGQTLPQPHVFGSLCIKSVDLPEVSSENKEAHWHCNRLVNEALLACKRWIGPVQINVPISDPFFDFSVTKLPQERVIKLCQHHKAKEFIASLAQGPLVLVLGQGFYALGIEELSEHVLLLGEHIANYPCQDATGLSLEQMLMLGEVQEQQGKILSVLSYIKNATVVTLGGHIISKRLKQYLRRNPPLRHVHVSAQSEVIDLFQCLDTVLECSEQEFIATLNEAKPRAKLSELYASCRAFAKQANALAILREQPFSQMLATGMVIEALPRDSHLHLANSSTVRYAQMFKVPSGVKVYSNRGTNGIEGSLSTALGVAAAVGEDVLNVLLIGDLSFFYDMNALWQEHVPSAMRIVLFNNQGGEIFNALPGLKMDLSTTQYVTAPHSQSAQGWTQSRGWLYQAVRSADELSQALESFLSPSAKPQILEVFSAQQQDIEVLKALNATLRQYAEH